MTQDRPTAAELIIAVREFLERDVMAATEGRVQFHTRVAVNVLGMVERELDRRAPLRCGGARARGRAARPRRRPPKRSNGSSRPRIRAGALDDRLDAVRAHVRETVREKLLVANPSYLRRPNLRTACASRPGTSTR